MIHLKTPQEIETMKTGGAILRKVRTELLEFAKPGVTTNEIEALARELTHKYGAQGSFTHTPGYSWFTCQSVNNQIVHTPPNDRKLVEGDVLTIDVGVLYGGYHTDSADTIVIGGAPTKEVERFLEAGKKALETAISHLKVGVRIGTVSKAIQDVIEGEYGYHVVPELTGHGIGRSLWEDPHVFNFINQPIDKTPVIENGLVIAIEPIYAMGTHKMKYEKGSDWTLVTADGSLAAQFEHTIAVTNKNVFILT